MDIITSIPEARRIVDDLISKYPRGPHRQQDQTHYMIGRVWCSHRHVHKSEVVLRADSVGSAGITELTVKHWGYEPLELFRLGVRGAETATKLLRRLYPNLKPTGLTRRSRILLARVERAVDHVKREGTEGIWSVSTTSDYGGLWHNMRIWGANKADVESKVRLIGPMTGLKPEWRLMIEFHDLGTPKDATQFGIERANQKLNRIKADIRNHREHLARLEEALEEEEPRAAHNMGSIMLLSGAEVDNEQEAAQ